MKDEIKKQQKINIKKKISEIFKTLIFVFISIFIIFYFICLDKTSNLKGPQIVIQHSECYKVIKKINNAITFNFFNDNDNDNCKKHVIGKPAIYIYPEKIQKTSVKLKIKGELTKDIPKYNDGWNVIVKPNGQMKVIGGNSQITYDYLFYENTVTKIITNDEAWLVEKDKLKEWFNIYLYKFGLNKFEADEFIDYWIPKLNSNYPNKKYVSIKLLDKKYLDEYMNLNITPKPDKTLRLEFVFRGFNTKFKTKEPIITPFLRNGYYAVEWGGNIE